jgi:chromosome segregation ATPase
LEAPSKYWLKASRIEPIIASQMNEEPTSEFTVPKSFEERVFQRFDAIEKRFDGVYARFDVIEIRLERVESRSYDTKPIWERALAAITHTNQEVGEVKSKIGAIENTLATVEGEIAALRTDYASHLENQKDFKVKIARRIDLVLETLVDTRENMRDSDARLSQLESKLA